MILKYLKDENTFDTEKFFYDLKSLEIKWCRIFDNTTEHHCPICSVNLKNLTPVLARDKMLNIFRCCSAFVCDLCLRTFLSDKDPNKYCPVCSTNYFDGTKTDYESDLLKDAFARNAYQFYNNFSMHRKVITSDGTARVGSAKNKNFLAKMQQQWNMIQ